MPSAKAIPADVGAIPFRNIDEAWRVVSNIAHALRLALDPIIRSPLAMQEIFRDVTFTAGQDVTLHFDLGQPGPPTGWFIIDATSGPPTAYRKAWNSRSLTLHATASGVATVCVF